MASAGGGAAAGRLHALPGLARGGWGSSGPRMPAPRSVDPFSKKDWYDIKAPSAFNTRNVGKTLVTRTAGTKVRRRGARGGRGMWRRDGAARARGGASRSLVGRAQIASDGLKGRVIEMSLADLQNVRAGGGGV